MDQRRRNLYTWAIFLAFMLLVLGALWLVFHREPGPHTDYGILATNAAAAPSMASTASIRL